MIRVSQFGYDSSVPLYRVQFEFNMDTGNELDKSVNTLHCIADNEAELESGFVVAMTTFYGAVDGHFSSFVDPAASRYTAYDLADPEPRAPVLDETFNLGTTGTNTAPAELAWVVSFEAPQQSGQAQARRRGRFYLGPLSASVMDATTGRFAAAMHDTLGVAVQNLLDASQAATTWAWAVYSRANGSAIEVTHAWVDNAYDVQRRRGLSATRVDDIV